MWRYVCPYLVSDFYYTACVTKYDTSGLMRVSSSKLLSFWHVSYFLLNTWILQYFLVHDRRTRTLCTSACTLYSSWREKVNKLPQPLISSLLPLMTQYLCCNIAAVEAQSVSGGVFVVQCCRQFLGCGTKQLFTVVSFPLSFPMGFLFPLEG